jgi:uncharacterized protein (UPF0303 family)
MTTTGGFASSDLLQQEIQLQLPHFGHDVALDIGALAASMGRAKNLGILVSVRIGDWEVFKAALPGSKPENDRWVQRKANVVNLTHHSTMFERVNAEETGTDWHAQHGVKDETHAIHGGGFPLSTQAGYQGILLISGLPQVEDHNFIIEVLSAYLKK